MSVNIPFGGFNIQFSLSHGYPSAINATKGYVGAGVGGGGGHSNVIRGFVLDLRIVWFQKNADFGA